MKRLTLIRHAKSSWKEPGLPDFDRPLNKRGRRDAPAMGRRLRDLGLVPELMVASPAVRAATTADLIAEGLGMDAGAIRLDPRLYDADLPTLYYIVHGLEDRWSHVAIVAHNPTLHWFAIDLTGTSIDRFRTCTVAHIDLDAAHWDEVVSGTGTLRHLLWPRDTSG